MFLSSCGDDPGEKRRKTECEKAGFKKGSSYEACIENDDSTFLYTLDFAIDEKIKEIKEYNLKVEKFNKIEMGINKIYLKLEGLELSEDMSGKFLPLLTIN